MVQVKKKQQINNQTLFINYFDFECVSILLL
jgi:hypothetical protein